MTGFYSKDFILESAYGQFYFSGTVVYLIATIGAMFTTLYSVKVLYLTFLTNPNGASVNYRCYLSEEDKHSYRYYYIGMISAPFLKSNNGQYYKDKVNEILSKLKPAYEGDIFMTLPLIVLAILSIFFGYITKDIFIGLGSGFFADNSIFIHPGHEIMLDTEFAVPTLFKLLPFVFTLSLTILAIIFSEFIPTALVHFKLSRFGYNLFGFFNQRFYIELINNRYITGLGLKLGGQTTKVLDKGSVELLGPYGSEKGLGSLSENIASLNTGVITSYALYILIGLNIYILIPYIILIDNSLFLLLLLCLLSLSNNKNSNILLSSKGSLKSEPTLVLVFTVVIVNATIATSTGPIWEPLVGAFEV